MSTVLHYVHDPMCSWCWGFRPCWDQIRAGAPPDVEIRQWLGGLAPDSDEPMPEALRATIQSHWRTIEQRLGTEFNHAFWSECKPRRSTWIACRAVIAARNQGHEEDMIRAIQHAYYLQAQNPSDPKTLAALAAQLELNVSDFKIDLCSQQTTDRLAFEMQTSRQWPISGFPSLLVEHRQQIARLPFDYTDPGSTLDILNSLVRS